jgi:hypothetical protein
LYDGVQIAKVVGVAGKFIPSQDLASRAGDSPIAGVVTAADELFFNLDGRIVSTTDDEWRLEVCGVHTSGTQHWVQLNVHGVPGCGLTLRTESLDAGDLLRRVDAWLSLVTKTGEPSLCTIGD